jgi:hypothetical protein
VADHWEREGRKAGRVNDVHFELLDQKIMILIIWSSLHESARFFFDKKFYQKEQMPMPQALAKQIEMRRSCIIEHLFADIVESYAIQQCQQSDI